jgi:acetyl esterase
MRTGLIFVLLLNVFKVKPSVLETCSDARMTSETKVFASLLLHQAKANQNLDLKTIRENEAKQTEEKNEKIKFYGLKIKDRLVQSIYDDNEIEVTTYVPIVKSPDAPITVFVHGGGFRFSSRKAYQPAIGYLAEATNSIWVSVDYRLSPESVYPAAFHDCNSVVEWILQNKKDVFGSSSNSKVGVAGDSAGGNLAAALSHEFGKRLDFQILVYPWLDLTCSSKTYQDFSDPCFLLNYNLAAQAARDYIGAQLESNASSVSPLFNEDFTDQPKSLLILAELDPLVEEGQKYYQKLQESKIPSQLVIVKGVIHGFFTNDGYTRYGFLEASNYIINFFKSFAALY